ncbi:MAG TPA: inorganic phosphate transporter [Chthoniobacterales bacterium]|nr:inorganic phosphate transporter [Chthoniobacterales bacterium]
MGHPGDRPPVYSYPGTPGRQANFPCEIMGVGAVKRFSGVKWTVVERIVWAWLLTLPATGLIGYVLARLAHQWS